MTDTPRKMPIYRRRKCRCGECRACMVRAGTWSPEEPHDPLYRLPAGEWRSGGEWLNYEPWPDRDRFVELDRLIAAGLGDHRRYSATGPVSGKAMQKAETTRGRRRAD